MQAAAAIGEVDGDIGAVAAVVGELCLQRDLARHIVGGMSTEAKDEIFAASRLPEDYKIHIKGTPTEVAERVIYEVVMRELVDLRDRHELYFLEEGEWRIARLKLVRLRSTEA